MPWEPAKRIPAWLTVGKVYNVMALELDNNGEWLARL